MRTLGAGRAWKAPLLPGAAWLAAVAALAPASAGAQDAVASARSLEAGAFEVLAYPLWLPGDGELGGLARAGFGLEDAVALRGHVGFFDDLAYFGASAEIRAARLDAWVLSAVLGVHRSDFDGDADILGFDVAAIARRETRSFSVYASLDFDLERPEEPFDSFNRSHLAIGLNAGLVEGIDLVAEGGLGFDDDSPDYLAAGVALRFD